MFEKEAEEYFETECMHTYADTEEELKEDVVPAFQKGAEFGYNKANEWHFVKDGDLPKDYQKCIFLSSNTYDKNYKIIFMESCINVFVGCYSFYSDEEGNETTEHCFYDENNDDEIDIKEVYAWKEIVLPELKESE